MLVNFKGYNTEAGNISGCHLKFVGHEVCSYLKLIFRKDMIGLINDILILEVEKRL